MRYFAGLFLLLAPFCNENDRVHAGGSWITPAIQFPRKNLDARSRVSAGPPPGAVLHPSLRGPVGATPAASNTATSVNNTATDAASQADGSDLGSGGDGGGSGGRAEESEIP